MPYETRTLIGAGFFSPKFCPGAPIRLPEPAFRGRTTDGSIMDKLELIKAFGAFFAIMNPFVNLPIFLSQTEGYTDAQQRSLAIKVSVYAVLMCGVILLVGNQIISFFGISVDQFRVAGGAVLAHIAWTMLNGAAAASHHGNG